MNRLIRFLSAKLKFVQQALENPRNALGSHLVIVEPDCMSAWRLVSKQKVVIRSVTPVNLLLLIKFLLIVFIKTCRSSKSQVA